MKKFFGVSMILCLFISLSAYSGEYKQIVSLAPSITENLYELGCEQFVKGITFNCPKGETTKDIIGTFMEPDIEKIVLLNPDLIVATKDGNNKTAVEKLIQLGFEVYVVEITKSFGDICGNYYNLANKLNKTKVAMRTINIAKCSLEKIRKKLKGLDKSKLLWVIGTNPLYTAGNRSFINDYNYYSKTLNVYRDMNVRYFTVSIDNIVERNPDVIVFVNMKPNVNISEIRKLNKYKSVKAVKNNKIHMFDSENMFLLTPLTFAKNVEKLVKVIYGDIV